MRLTLGHWSLAFTFLSAFTLPLAPASADPDFRVGNTSGGVKLKRGQVIRSGDKVVTGESQEVELKTEDGSKIVLTQNSEAIVTTSEHATQTVELKSGKLVGASAHKDGEAARKSKTTQDAKKYRFLIRTQTAVMGVRGTQFVVETSEKETRSKFYVIDGVVDIANDITELLTNNFVVVQTGQLVATAGKGVEFLATGAKDVTATTTEFVESGVRGVSKAMPFDVLGFLADMNKKLPRAFHIPLLTGEKNTEDESDPGVIASITRSLGSVELYSQGYFASRSMPPGRQSYGVGLAWTPTFTFPGSQFEARFHAGVPRLMRGGTNAFDEWEFKVSAIKIIKTTLYAELGPIFRIYNGDEAGFGLSATTGIWFGDRPLLRILERAFFGVNYVSSIFPKWEYRFGIGARIF